ncbi:TPA: glycoside hydrolase family protein [Vibrio cholerae]|uniref:Lysozyme n=1 Tax=Vibrio diazotrophicus TaxID=685 RepID=A0A329E946_VIBDI|nr:glycoside hydrolase family protein [Vibrio diazotrophicus]RAS62647.1 GH24 family phage-related lysozyme (muramidase) [Vibrio diazotrophicus]
MKKNWANVVLEFEEGYREKPYHCSEGYPTVGIGKKIGPKGCSLDCYDFSVSRDVANLWLSEEINSVNDELNKLNWYLDLNPDRQVIITSMAYQMGLSGLLKFKKMISSLERGNWDEAAYQALDSRWAKQTPKRANRHAEVLRSGSISSAYGKLL